MYRTHTRLLFTAKPFHNLSLPLSVSAYSTSFSGAIYAWWDIAYTQLWSMGNYIKSSWFLWINTDFSLAFVLIVIMLWGLCLLHCSLPHNPCILLLTSVTNVHNLPAHDICTCLNSSPIACPLSSVLVYDLTFMFL